MPFKISSSHEFSSQFSKPKKAAPKDPLFDEEFNLSFDTDYSNGPQPKIKRTGGQSRKLGMAISQCVDAQADFY